MTILKLKSKFLFDLKQLYPKEEILAFFFLLADFRLNLSRTSIALEPNLIITSNDLDFFNTTIKELILEKPIQYIIGKTEFYGLPFKINQNVLIPRPETQELVAWILKTEDQRLMTNNNIHLNILDIGTGSGCIAISLAKHLPNATVFALDISTEALKIAKQNANLNKVSVHFIEHNILNTKTILNLSKHLLKSLKFDIIVSNPPYVRNSEKEQIKNNVLENEPHLALFVEDQKALIFYEAIAYFAKNYLTKNGQLFLEINQYLAKETSALLQQKDFTNIELKKDLFGNDRIIKTSFIKK